ncbi:MAG: capsular biosynthesis protein [Sideroxydans sp.]|nr:capsular biosynthesis protein [Sideroxydans sp.]
MIEQGINAFRGKRVLLLQGPVGPFFRRLARDLTQVGAQVYKVNFNGGDWLFYPSGATNFRGHPEDWPAYFEALLDRLNVDVVMLFGDCRLIHQLAHEIVHRRGLEIGVFEEGYVRPDYVTLERFGVNNHSLVPRTPEFYLTNSMPSVERPMHIGKTFWYTLLWAILYYFAAGLLKPLFSHYRHHRPLTWLEALPLLRSLYRKGKYTLKERGALGYLTGKLEGRYFLVPLQVHNDAQVVVHSDFDSVIHFIEEVTASFAQHAPLETILVIKHHPMDRGYHDYSKLIREQVEKLGLQGRCLYIHDQHLPALLQHARGVVVINSTVGLSALHHGVPLKVCGNAMYDMEGLTFQRPLDDFWQHAQQCKPEAILLHAFHGYLVLRTQLNASFYKRLPSATTATGMRWTTMDYTAKYAAASWVGEVENNRKLCSRE